MFTWSQTVPHLTARRSNFRSLPWFLFLFLMPLLSMAAQAAPVITSFTPTSGPVGTRVYVLGSDLLSTTSVQFGNGTTTDLSFKSDGTALSALVPSTATTGIITVNTPAGSASSTSVFTVVGTTTPPAPTITGFTPTSGPVGTRVVIAGANLTSTTAVQFNGVAATQYSYNSLGTELVAYVPTGATTGPITIINRNGNVTSANNFTVTSITLAAPIITSFTPHSGPVGTRVYVLGTGLLGATSVQFGNGTTTDLSVKSDGTALSAIVPSTATTGIITVTTPAGSASSTDIFTVTVVSTVPTITGFTPTSGPIGTRVVIVGTNLTGATSVQFNGASTTQFSYNSLGTELVVYVPAGAKTGRITVVNPHGNAASSSDFQVQASKQPVIYGFLPSGGPTGIKVYIMGAGFTGATSVRFGTAYTTSFSVNSDGTIVSATVPAEATTGPIRVATPVGVAYSTPSFIAAPRITGITPEGGIRGTVVTITGVNFAGATAVLFGPSGHQLAAPFTATDGKITAYAPAGVTTGHITVTTVAGTATSSAVFLVSTAATP